MVEPMQMIAPVTQQVLNEVNDFLETQTVYVQETLKRLDDLRGAVVRRDEGALAALFEQVRRETERKEQSALALQMFRRKLAGLLNCSADQVCLSTVCQKLPPEDRKAVSVRQAALQGLVRRLTNEHRATESLLRECTRFNRLLLNSLCGNRQEMTTYDARGMNRWSVQGGLMNVRF
jgi:hypothetical protein